MRVVRAADGRLAAPDPGAARIADRLGDTWTLSDRVLVRAGDRRLVSRAAGLGLARVTPLAVSKGWCAIDAGSIGAASALAEKLARDAAVTAVELDATPPIEQRSAPNDPLYGQQWHLSNAFIPGVDVRAPEAWALGYTGAGVVIGIVESNGFLTGHEDLAPNYDAFLSQSTGFTSDHMTQVAGIAAGAGNNGSGVAGVAYDATRAQRLIGSNSATASALRALGAEEARHAEPACGLGELLGPGRVHAGEGGGALGAERVEGVAAGAREAEQLAEDALAGLDGVEIGVLEGGSGDLLEAVADGDGAPGLGDVALAEQVFGVEVAGALGGLESSGAGGHRRMIPILDRLPVPGGRVRGVFRSPPTGVRPRGERDRRCAPQARRRRTAAMPARPARAAAPGVGIALPANRRTSMPVRSSFWPLALEPS